MVQYLEVPKSPSPSILFTPSYRSLNTRSFINGFYSNSARDSRGCENMSSYTRRSNSDYGLPRIYHSTPPSSLPQPISVTSSTPVASTPPSLNCRFDRLSIIPIDNGDVGGTVPTADQKVRKLNHSPNQGSSFYTRKSSKKTMTIHEMLHIFGAELLGTAILMFVGCSANPLNAMWAFAIAAMAAIHIIGPISGAHINPGATIVAFIMGKLHYKFVPIYWIAQFLGGIIGYALFYEIVLVDPFSGKCMTKPTPTIGRTLGIEIILSFIFFMAIASLWDPKNKHSSDTASLKFGFILFGLVISVFNDIPLSMNTARSLPPALFTGDFEGHWVYWIGPNLGAAIAGGMYRQCFMYRPYLDLPADPDLS